MKQKPKLSNMFNRPRMVLPLAAMFFYALPSHAVIPPSVAINTTVSGIESSVGAVTVQSGVTLTITGTNAIATVNGTITVKPGGKLQVINGATLKMAGNAKISLLSMAGTTGANLKVDNSRITNITGLTSTPWSGIETSNGGTTINYWAQADILNNSTIENATIGYRNYVITSPNYSDNVSAPTNTTTAGGKINAMYSTFRNCGLDVSICNSFGNGVPNNITTTTFNVNWAALFQYCNFVQSLPYTPVTPFAMVRLTNCTNVTFYSCHFTSNNPSNQPFYPSIAISASNASFFLQAYPSNTTARCTVSGLSQAIYVNNSLQTDRVCVIANTDFDNFQYATDMGGCLNPYIIGCTYSSNKSNSVAINLRNSTGYKIEANTMTATNGTSNMGIVVRNSGTVYNQIYRNTANSNILGLESVGVNRNFDGSTGLKFLCNSLSNITNSGIAVISDPTKLYPQGIANQQYSFQTIWGKFPLTAIVPAGNTFRNNPVSWDFYVGSNTNNLSQLSYRYSPSVLGAKPIYTNMLSTNIIGSSYANTCPVVNVGAPGPKSFSIGTFINSNAVIEGQIVSMEAQVAQGVVGLDTPLDILHAQHDELIDSIIDYYQYMGYSDTTGNGGNYTDSIALVYKQVNVGYQYKIYLASAYAVKGQYDYALDALSAILQNYSLTDDEVTYINNLSNMFTVRKWLYENDNDWDNIPDYLRDIVYQQEAGDPMFAGAMARAIRAEFEGATYEPYFAFPPDISLPFAATYKLPTANSIYPNPTDGHASVNWSGDDAVLILYNIAGKKILDLHITAGKNDLDMTRLNSGIYIAEIQVDGKSMYKQRIVKK